MDILHLSLKEVNEIRDSFVYLQALKYCWAAFNLRRIDLPFKEEGQEKDIFELFNEADL